MIRRFRTRWRCHRSLWCCRIVDQPLCNGWHDPHTLARWRYRRSIERLENARGRR